MQTPTLYKKMKKAEREAISLKATNLIKKRIAITAELLSSLKEELPQEGLPKGFGYPGTKEGRILELLESITRLDEDQTHCLMLMAQYMEGYQRIPTDDIDDDTDS